MKNPKVLLQHVLSAIANIELFTTGATQDEFLSNFMMQHAVIRNIEVIGEASKNIGVEIKNTFPAVPWRDITAMRNKLIHDYFALDAEAVWFVVKNDLPKLKQQMVEILNTEL